MIDFCNDSNNTTKYFSEVINNVENKREYILMHMESAESPPQIMNGSDD